MLTAVVVPWTYMWSGWDIFLQGHMPVMWDVCIPCSSLHCRLNSIHMWHLRGILIFGTYMGITCFQSHNVNGAINDNIVFLLLRWLFRSMIWLSVLGLVLVSVPCGIDSAIGIIWCWCQWHHMTRNGMLHIFSVILTQGMQWYHYWWHWYHVTWTLAPVAWHYQKCVAPHFNCLNIMNAVVTLKMLSASCDARSSAKSVTWPQKSCYTQFWAIDAIDDAIDIMWWQCNGNANGVTWSRNHVRSLNHLDPRNAMVPIEDTVSIIGYQHWCHWCHMTRKVILIMFTSWILLCYWWHFASSDSWHYVMPVPSPVVSYNQK